MELKKQIMHKKNMEVFNSDWSGHGFTALCHITGDAALETFVTDRREMIPFVLVGCTSVASALGTATAEHPIYWIKEFSKAASARDSADDKSAAPMTARHRAGLLQPLFEKVVIKGLDIDTSVFPSLTRVCEPWLFQYNHTFVNHGWEPDCLGSVRIFVSGQLHFLFIPGSQLKHALDAVSAPACRAEDGLEVRARTFFESWSKDKSDQYLGKLKEGGVTIHHGVVDARSSPAVVVCPPGYFVSSVVLGNSVAAGVRKSFLTKGSKGDVSEAFAKLPEAKRSGITQLLQLSQMA